MLVSISLRIYLSLDPVKLILIKIQMYGFLFQNSQKFFLCLLFKRFYVLKLEGSSSKTVLSYVKSLRIKTLNHWLVSKFWSCFIVWLVFWRILSRRFVWLLWSFSVVRSYWRLGSLRFSFFYLVWTWIHKGS